MMGAGIAYECARAGMEVAQGRRPRLGREGQGVLGRHPGQGRRAQEDHCGEARRDPRAHPADREHARRQGRRPDDRGRVRGSSLKKGVYAEVVLLLTEDALLGSNTSSLPITGLAEGVDRPADHRPALLRPWTRCNLLEIVVGKETSDATLAKAIDVALQIRNADRGQRQPRLLHQPGHLDRGGRGCGAGRRGCRRTPWTGGHPGRPPGRPPALTDEEPHARREDRQGGAGGGRGRGRHVRGAPGLPGDREDGQRARPRWSAAGAATSTSTARRRLAGLEGVVRRREPGHPVHDVQDRCCSSR